MDTVTAAPLQLIKFFYKRVKQQCVSVSLVEINGLQVLDVKIYTGVDMMNFLPNVVALFLLDAGIESIPVAVVMDTYVICVHFILS